MQNIILDSITTAVIMLDEKLALRYMNTAAEALLESSLQKSTGQPAKKFFSLEGDWQAEIQGAINKKASFTRRQIPITLTNSQRNITVDYTVSPINEIIDGHSCALIEMQGLDRLLSISREEALLSSEQTSRSLIRGLAHEIKNPLGGIRGAAQLLSRELEKPELSDYTQVIIDEADRLRNLVDRMLGINRPLTLQDLNIHEALEHIAALIEVEMADRIQLIRDYDPSLPLIHGDKEQLIQVLLNIARNAIQALESSSNKKGENRITLKTRAQHHFTIGQQQHGMVCRVDIIDNGDGIPEEIADNIFYPMITGRPEGTGLGLAIAQSIVIQHQGLIKCQSVPGKTIFSLYLPLSNPSVEITE